MEEKYPPYRKEILSNATSGICVLLIPLLRIVRLKTTLRMKTTILISFVVVVLGLYWPKQQPVANTTTDFTRTNSILPNASLSYFTGEKQQILTIQPEAYYSTQHLHLSPPESKYRYKNLQLYPVYASTVFVNHHRSLGHTSPLSKASLKASSSSLNFLHVTHWLQILPISCTTRPVSIIYSSKTSPPIPL